MRRSKKICTVLLMLCTLLTGTITASAKSRVTTAYSGYEYNIYEESSAAPIAYVPEKILNSEILGLNKALKSPSDFVYDGKGVLYVLDSGNSRIIAVNTGDYTVNGVFDKFTDAAGEKVTFIGATGLAVTDNVFYIADTENTRVLVFNRDCVLKKLITRPDSALGGTEAPFDVSKVMVDSSGKIYVIAKSINNGIMTFDEAGNFLNFYGSNKVEATVDVIKNYFINKFLTKEQRASRSKITPTNFANMALDNDGFVYTVKSDAFDFGSSDVVQCLNYEGNNIIDSDVSFGEFENDSLTYYQNRMHCRFVDIDIDDSGFMNILDAGRGRVYQYNLNGDMLAAFGSYGDFVGSFTDPVAVASINSNIAVLDSLGGEIQIFARTAYGNDLHCAFTANESNDLDNRLELWEQVLSENTNSAYPYYYIGIIYDQKGMYSEAMDMFRTVGAQEEYSKSFQQYRKEIINDYAWIIILAFAAICAACYMLSRIYRKHTVVKEGVAHSPLEQKKYFPLYILFRPMDGFEQFRYRNIASWLIAIIIIVFLFAVNTVKFFATGFAFSIDRSSDYELSIELFKSFGLFLMFVVANWSVCTLLNGKGNFKQIFVSVAYCLLPYIFSVLINTILSNLLTQREEVFMMLVTTVGIIWSLILLFCALTSIHEYSFSATLGAILLTVVGMLIIGFLLVLFCSLLMQVYNFALSVISELQLRS